MLIKQIDPVDLEPLERAFHRAADVVWLAVQWRCSRLFVRSCQIEAELGRDNESSMERREPFADEFFIDERPVNLRGIEEGNTPLHRRVEQRNHLLFIL